MTEQLKPCPFCEGVNVIHSGYRMYCHACGAEGPDADNMDESAATEAWNTRADLAQPDVAEGWQPIETAPKDGTVIDLWHEEFGRDADCYWGLPDHCCGEMGRLCDSDWHSLEPGWVSAFNEIISTADAYTHWMPLPAAPKGGA